MISNSPTVAEGGAGTAPPAAGGIGSWFTRSNVGLLREVALLGNVATPRNLLFVLNAIRQAVAED